MTKKLNIQEFAKYALSEYNRLDLKRSELLALAKKEQINIPTDVWKNKIKRGVYHVGSVNEESISLPTEDNLTLNESGVRSVSNAQESYVPDKDPLYVPWGIYKESIKIIKSGMFYPTFVTGLSGNGKTLGLEQACAVTGREFFRVNITAETDEDDLMGGFRLINGDTVWQNGPVLDAMKRGAILVLDEIDLGSSKIMCLQSVLEGKGYFTKKLGHWIKPEAGFQIFATANTKGKGSDSGQFAFTNILNEAMLDRFAITLYQKYPTKAVETKILKRVLDMVLPNNGKDDCEFVDNLVTWGDIIRSTYDDGGVDEVISTRRLVSAIKAYIIFDKNKAKAIKVTVERFDDEVSNSFKDLYNKIDSGDNLDYSAIDDDDSDDLDERLTEEKTAASHKF